MTRRRKRRGRGSSDDGVELNMAAMLDMAFQLLTFFILTFKPSPIEGQISMNLPPPIAVAQSRPINVDQPASTGPALPGFGTLVISVRASDGGELQSLIMGDRQILSGPLTAADAALLDGELQNVFSLSGGTYDAIQLHIDPKLKYETFLLLMDICAKQTTADGQRMEKLSFIELP